MEISEIMQAITNSPEDGHLYILLGDKYAEGGCVNQAYLCYEQAWHCNAQDTEAIAKMEESKLNAGFAVHPASFIILSYNSMHIMKECLQAIRTCCAEGSYEVIVVDSASTDGVREWLMQQDDIILLLNDRFEGFSAGCNQGAKRAQIDNDIFLLNNDAILTPRAFFYMRLALYSDERFGAVGPISANVIYEQLYDNIQRSHDEWMQLATEINHPSENPVQFAHWLQGHALLIKRRVWDQVGMFDTDFKFGGHEDVEYGIRLNLAGWHLGICKNAFIYHYGSTSMKTVSETYRVSLERNYRLLEEKYDIPLRMVLQSAYYGPENLVDIDIDADIKILQINCGCCNSLNLLKYRYPNITTYAIETNSVAVQIASNYTHAYCLNVDTDLLPFDDNSLDYIFFFEIERCESLQQVLPRLKRLLKPGGHLIIEGKNANHISVIESLIHGSMESKLLAGCKRLYTTDDLHKLVLSCGFSIPRLQWRYNSAYSSLTESQQRILDTILSLPDAKDRNTYIHTSVTIDAQK